MADLFLSILNMSLTASYVILFIILVRLTLKKAPKAISYALWGVAAFRLLCPFSFRSILSLIPMNTSPIPQDIAYQQTPQINTGIAAVNTYVNGSLPAPEVTASANPLQIYTQIGLFIWLLGIAVMLAYSIVSVLILKNRLKSAGYIEGNIYEADNLKTPFVLGIFRPRIFIPAGLTEEEKSYIIRHEQTHIKRLDHIVKPLAFLILSLHWFNPLVWLAFVLMGTDMELSCDERVIKELGGDIKKAYSASLLSLATQKRIMNGSPLAFGEGNVRVRIKNVLNYKKPTFWVVAVAVVAISVLCVALISNPLKNETSLMGSDYQVKKVVYDTTASLTPETQSYYSITANYDLYTTVNESGKPSQTETWEYAGTMEAYPLTSDELKDYTEYDAGWVSKYKVGEITDAYILRLADDHFYLAIQTASGDTLLGYGYEDVQKRGQGASDDTSLEWIFLLDSTLRQNGANVNFFDRSLASAVGESVQCFSFYETDGKKAYMIVGFLVDGSSAKSDMGFATFRFKDGRYQVIDCYVYGDAAIITMPSATDSTIYNGIHLAEDLAVCYQYGKPSEDVKYEIILSNNEQLSAITRMVDGKKEYTNTVVSNPSMSVFRRSKTDDQHEVSYELYYVNGITGELRQGSNEGSTEASIAYTDIEPTVPELSPDQTLGADMASLDYASDDIVIFHDYFGLFVYDLKSLKIIRSLDLKPLNCHYTQGDNACQVTVSTDGNTVRLNPNTGKDMYVYTISDNTLKKTVWQPMDDVFSNFVWITDIMDFDKIGNCSIKAVSFDTGEYGYLRASDWTLGTLTYVRDDMVYALFDAEA